MDLLHLAIEIAGRLVELLAFPLVHVRPDGVTIGAMEFRVHVDQRLHVVVTWGNVLETGKRIAGCTRVDGSGLPCWKLADVRAEKGRFLLPGTNLLK